MTIAEIRQILESPYDRKVWKGFLQTQFTNNKLNAEDRIIPLSDKTLSKQCLSLGNYEINEYAKIGIFEVELNVKVNITRNRVALRNLIKDLTKQVGSAMVVFVQGDKWRFSYISKRKIINKDTKEIQNKETDTKRYTYLFGRNEKALTAAIRFSKLIQKQKENIFELLSLDDFEDAFSVEKLTKEFFKNYKDTYEDFVQFLTGKRYGKKGTEYVELVFEEPNWQLEALFDKDEKQARDFCKRMMGRIVFLYFIQKKGWLAVAQGKKWGEGNPDYLYDLFRDSKHKDDFYYLELVPLFFKTLNNTDSESKINAFRFPYLNGGLFDDSQDKKYNKLQLPEHIFQNLFETFNNFNFTIYEDAPDEQTVAVDPEMLGHIFENLLEDNKDKGAFYTPKEIVHYMCKESLKAYLFVKDEQHVENNELANRSIDKIIQHQELSSDEKNYAEKNAYKIIDALEQVKICDPAIGSGAFPMGLLQEIFNAQIFLQEIKGFKKGVSDADIKKHIIEESIYGVDIDAGAVDIARLRFWLSLVVDELEPQPLPNLDFKILCANTLIPTGYDKFIEMAEKSQAPTLLRMDSEIQKLQSIRDNYFKVKNRDEKEKIKTNFKNTKSYLLTEFKSLRKSWNLGDFIDKIEDWNPFGDKSCSWFDAWWMFGTRDGFDIVIGNPPYRQLQKEGGKLAKLYEPYKYETFERTGDIYSLFYEKGTKLLKEKGILCFITSNKWMRANYGASTRQFFAEKTHPLLLIDFGNIQVFDTAAVDTNILLLQNKPKAQKEENIGTLAVKFRNDFQLSGGNIKDYVFENSYNLHNLNHNSWVVGEKDIYNIKEYIEQQGVILKNWKNLSIDYGVKTGLNDAFIISHEIKESIIKRDPNSSELLKPIIRGKDISAWYPDYKNLWLITTFPSLHINIEKYIGIKEHLLSYGIERLLQDGKGRKRTGNEWFETQDQISYWEKFNKPKIMYRDITQKFDFSYVEDTLYSNNTIYVLSGCYLKYLTCFLNSKLFSYTFRDNFTDLGARGRRLFTVFFNKIPVKYITDKQEIPFAKIVDYLVALKKENSTEPTDKYMYNYFEQIANGLVFELYFKEEFDNRKLVLANYVAELDNLNDSENLIYQLRKIYISVNHDNHPLKVALFKMLAIPQIELIMNTL